MAFAGRDFLLLSTGTSEYTLTKEDVGRHLAFVYIPTNFEGLSIALLYCVYSYLVDFSKIIM
jgi:hypothetical protein